MDNSNRNTNIDIDMPHELMWGQIIMDTGGYSRSIIATSTIFHIPMESPNFAYKSMMSLDGLFSIASISGGTGVATGSPTGQIALPRYSMITGYPTGTITVNELNPFQSGHNIDILAHGTGITTEDNLYAHNKAQDYRFLALRGPMMIHGWGYDTNGYPIPNIADSASGIASGIFVTDGLGSTFHPDYLKNSKLWPVGPTDIRFDRARGVWVAGVGGAPSQFGMAILLTDLIAGYTSLAENLTYNDNMGWIPNGTIITIWDRMMQNGSISMGTIIRYTVDGTKNWCDGSSCVNMMGILYPI